MNDGSIAGLATAFQERHDGIERSAMQGRTRSLCADVGRGCEMFEHFLVSLVFINQTVNLHTILRLVVPTRIARFAEVSGCP